jgi:hypothetical protein
MKKSEQRRDGCRRDTETNFFRVIALGISTHKKQDYEDSKGRVRVGDKRL